MKFQPKFIHFHARKCIQKCRLRNGVYFVSASMRSDYQGSSTCVTSFNNLACLSQHQICFSGMYCCFHFEAHICAPFCIPLSDRRSISQYVFEKCAHQLLPRLLMPWHLASPIHQHQYYPLFLWDKWAFVWSEDWFQLHMWAKCRQIIGNFNVLSVSSNSASKGNPWI